MLEHTGRGAGGEIQLTDALRELVAGGDFYGYVFEGRRYDAGEKIGYLKATVDYALRHPALSGEFRAYLTGLFGNGKEEREPVGGARLADRGKGARRRV